jgi:hypothetical protein
LLAFYLLPDGLAVADFSGSSATSTPSGIQSEQLAVNSLARTLEANVPQVKRLKILIHGQEMDTLAGHVDLTQLFVVDSQSGAARHAFCRSSRQVAIPAAASNATSPQHR